MRLLHLRRETRVRHAHLNGAEIDGALARQIEQTDGTVFARTGNGVVIRVLVHHPHGAAVGVALVLHAHRVEVHFKDLALETRTEQSVVEKAVFRIVVVANPHEGANREVLMSSNALQIR